MDLTEINTGILRSLCRLLKIPDTRQQFHPPVLLTTLPAISLVSNQITIPPSLWFIKYYASNCLLLFFRLPYLSLSFLSDFHPCHFSFIIPPFQTLSYQATISIIVCLIFFFRLSYQSLTCLSDYHTSQCRRYRTSLPDIVMFIRLSCQSLSY